MRSGAKNTLKKRGVKAPQEPPDAPLLQRLERVQRERRRSPELARRPAGQRWSKTAGFTGTFIINSIINFIVNFIINGD